MIPVFQLKPEYEANMAEIDAAVHRVLASGWYLMGGELTALEEEFAAWQGATHAVGVHSGTDALILALRAAGVTEGDEVITTAMTAVYTGFAISAVGATPVFVDSAASGYNIDVDGIDAAISPKTKAIIPVHLHGVPCNMPRIMEIAKKHSLIVVEDCAQAHGATFNETKVGNFGDLACFSFYPSKNMGAYGDAGMVSTNDAAFAEEVILLRNGGLADRKEYLHTRIGPHSRLDEIQSAILRVKLAHLDEWTARRRDIAAQYNDAFKELPITLPEEPQGARSVYHLYVIGVDDQERLRTHLSEKEIGTQVHYLVPLPHQPAYEHHSQASEEFPNASRAAQRMVSLPMYPYMTDAEVSTVSSAVVEFFS